MTTLIDYITEPYIEQGYLVHTSLLDNYCQLAKVIYAADNTCILLASPGFIFVLETPFPADAMNYCLIQDGKLLVCDQPVESKKTDRLVTSTQTKNGQHLDGRYLWCVDGTDHYTDNIVPMRGVPRTITLKRAEELEKGALTSIPADGAYVWSITNVYLIKHKDLTIECRYIATQCIYDHEMKEYRAKQVYGLKHKKFKKFLITNADYRWTYTPLNTMIQVCIYQGAINFGRITYPDTYYDWSYMNEYGQNMMP